MTDFLKRILLTPRKDEVEIIGRPSDEDLSVLSEALGKDSKPALLAEEVQRLLPLRLTTNQSVGGEQRSAILEIIPQRIVRLAGDQGWSLRGQSTNASDFAKPGNWERAPIAEAIFGPVTGKDHFVVV